MARVKQTFRFIICNYYPINIHVSLGFMLQEQETYTSGKRAFCLTRVYWDASRVNWLRMTDISGNYSPPPRSSGSDVAVVQVEVTLLPTVGRPVYLEFVIYFSIV
jgi:hypothetical protein